MLVITDAAAMARALASSLDPQLKDLLALRRDQLLHDTAGEYELGDLVHIIVVQPGDSIAGIEAAANFPLFTEPAFEWAQDHGRYLESVVILSDDGFGIAIFVPDTDGGDPSMLSILREQAER
jgi:hypothetical protein